MVYHHKVLGYLIPVHLYVLSGARPTLLYALVPPPPAPIALDWFVIFSIGGLTCPLRLVFVVIREQLTDNPVSGLS